MKRDNKNKPQIKEVKTVIRELGMESERIYRLIRNEFDEILKDLQANETDQATELINLSEENLYNYLEKQLNYFDTFISNRDENNNE